VRAIDQAMVDEVWREMAAYAPGRVAAEAQAFLAQQPHVAAFVRSATTAQDPDVQKAAFGLCFLLFKVLERSLGRPFPLLAEERIREAYEAAAEWLEAAGGSDPEALLDAASDPGHPTLVSYILSVFYGEGAGPADYDRRVKAALFLLLRTLTDALDIGQVEA
jgi:hypothetical protein